MIKVVAKSRIQEGKKEKYIKIAEELIEKTRNEDKNISYELYQDIENSDVFTFIEEWEDKEGLDKHMESSHFQRIVPQLNALRKEEGEINIYELVK